MKNSRRLTMVATIAITTATATSLTNLASASHSEINTTRNLRSSWQQEDLFRTCRDLFASSKRICDPDNLLDVPSHYSSNDYDDSVDNTSGNNTALHAITIALQELKTNHRLPTSLNNNCQNKDGLSIGKPISMAVVIVSSVFEFRGERDDEIASLMNYAWDANHDQECEWNDILLFISMEDEIIDIHSSELIKEILTRRTINSIADSMRPSLNHKRYAASIIVAIENIIRSIDEERFSKREQGSDHFLNFVCIFLAVTLVSIFIFKQDQRIEGIQRSLHLREYSSTSQDRSNSAEIAQSIIRHASQESLLEEYDCACCVICHSDYEDDYQKTRVSNGKEVDILPCGHPFHRVCIEKWFHTGRPSSNACPICRVELGGRYTNLPPLSPGFSTDMSVTSQSSFERALERHQERQRRRRSRRRRGRRPSGYWYEDEESGLETNSPEIPTETTRLHIGSIPRYDNDRNDNPIITRLPLSPNSSISGEIWTTGDDQPHPLRPNEEPTSSIRQPLTSLPQMPANDAETRYQTPDRRPRLPLPWAPRPGRRAIHGFTHEQFQLIHRAELIEEGRLSFEDQ